jgi:DNA repair exonuclease SbcCD ATPase subunit
MLKFKKLILRNFMSFGNYDTVLNFENFNTNEAILIKGENLDDDKMPNNGTGKSSLITDAPCYALFGKTMRNTDLMENIIHNSDTTSNECSVILIFEKDNNEYIIERTRTKNSQKVLFTTPTGIYKNNTGAQEKIEEITGFTYNTFLSTVFPGGKYAFADLSSAERFSLFSKLFNELEKYDRAKEKAKNSINNYKNMLLNSEKSEEILNTKITSIKSNLTEIFTLQREVIKKHAENVKNIKIKIEEIKKDIKELHLEHDNKLKNLFKEKDDFERKTKAEKNVLQKELNKIIEDKSRETDALKIKLQEKQYNLSKFERDNSEKIGELGEEITIQEKIVKKLFTESVKLNTKLDDINEKIKEFKNVGAKCFVCYSDISKKHYENQLNKLNTERENIENNLKEINQAEEEITLKNLKQKLSILEKEDKENLRIKRLIENEINEITGNIRNIQITLESKTEIIKEKINNIVTFPFEEKQDSIKRDFNKWLKSKETSQQSYYKELEAAENSKETEKYDELIKNKQHEINLFSDELNILLKNKNNYIENIAYYEFCFNNFPIAKSIKMKTLLDNFEMLTNKYLSNFSSGITVKYETEKANKKGDLRNYFDIIINDFYKSIPLECWSSGEQQRVRMAISLGLADLLCETQHDITNLLIIDEPNNNLDIGGRNGILEMIRKRAREYSQIIFEIDHDAEFQSLFDNILKIEKFNGQSRIHE